MVLSEYFKGFLLLYEQSEEATHRNVLTLEKFC